MKNGRDSFIDPKRAVGTHCPIESTTTKRFPRCYSFNVFHQYASRVISLKSNAFLPRLLPVFRRRFDCLTTIPAGQFGIQRVPRVIGVLFLVLAAAFMVDRAVFAADATDATPPDPVKLALESVGHFARIDDYTCTFLKQEFMNGGLLPLEEIELKFRKPFDFYMKWLNKPYRNREMIYRQGINDGKLIAHEGGLLGLVTVSLSPTGSLAMKNNHHPIFDAGLGSTIHLVVRGLKVGLARNEVSVTYMGAEKVDDRLTYKFEGMFPKDCRGQTYIVKQGDDLWAIAKAFDQDMFVIQHNNPGIGDPYDIKPGQRILIPWYYCQRIIVFIDTELRVPIKLFIYDWQGNLYEMYHYQHLKLNVGLTDADFDPNNESYNF